MEPKKIIVIEDDVALAEIYAVKLRAGGQNLVMVAHDGDAGLTLIQKENPDLVISDIMMPKMSGFDMLDILRSNPDTVNTKVILMTALSGDAEKARGEHLKADKYFVKSGATIDDLVKAAFELLTGQQTAAAAAPVPAPTSVSPAPAMPVTSSTVGPQPTFAQPIPPVQPAQVAQPAPIPNTQAVQPQVETAPTQGVFSAPK
jgi:DNA-binding response OmpR family regulator